METALKRSYGIWGLSGLPASPHCSQGSPSAANAVGRRRERLDLRVPGDTKSQSKDRGSFCRRMACSKVEMRSFKKLRICQHSYLSLAAFGEQSRKDSYDVCGGMKRGVRCSAMSSKSEKVDADNSEIRDSLEGLVRSLEELSSSLQRVTSALSHTLSSLDSTVSLRNVPAKQEEHMQQANFGRRSQSDPPIEFSLEGLSEAEERNSEIGRVAFKLQQAFVQARVDFLGMPFQLALEEFVDCTMRAYSLGVDLLTLQLQLVLAERACYGNDPAEHVQEMVTQEGHVRAMWIRLAYITLNHAAEVKAAKAGEQSAADIRIDPQEDLDGQGEFVKSVIQMHLEQGLTLDRLRLEQAYAEKTDSPAIEALQQSHYLVLMTLAKALGEY